MKFKDFQAPALFSSTFKALNLGEKIQVLSRTFKDALEPCTFQFWVSEYFRNLESYKLPKSCQRAWRESQGRASVVVQGRAHSGRGLGKRGSGGFAPTPETKHLHISQSIFNVACNLVQERFWRS